MPLQVRLLTSVLATPALTEAAALAETLR